MTTAAKAGDVVGEWTYLGDGIEAKVDGKEALVSQPGDADDGEVRDLLHAVLGGTWSRRSDWAAAAGEADVTARWAAE